MILKLITTLTCGAAIFCLVLVIYQMIVNKITLIRFKKLSRNLPIHPDANWLGDHGVNVIIGRRSCQNLRNYHEKLGKTIGFLKGDRHCVSTVDLDLIKLIVKDESGTHMDRFSLGLPAEEFEKSIMLARADEWPDVRRAIAQAMTPNKFKTPNVQRELRDTIDRLVGFIERKLDAHGQDQLFDVDDFVGRFSGSIVAKCFYKQDNLIDFDDPHDLWTHMLEDSLVAMNQPVIKNIFLNFQMTTRLIDCINWHFTQLGFARRTVLSFVKDQTKLAMEAGRRLRELKLEAAKSELEVDPDDFLLEDGTRFRRNMIDHFIDHYLDGKISKEQYLNNSCFIMAAANRTVADCVMHTIYLLSIHHEVQDKLRDSIQSRGADSEYLDWVLKESLRLLPPAAIGCSRTVERDIELASGHLLPKRTFVHTNAFVIHRLKEYWGEDADEFRPERWRDTSHHHPMQYIPFGAGPRGCPGKQFAIHEMKMLFATLLARYKFSGKFRPDAYEFDAPLFAAIISSSPTLIKISRL